VTNELSGFTATRVHIPKALSKLSPDYNLVHNGQAVLQVIIKIVQRHIEELGLLNASQFGFRDRHITTIQFMRLADHVTPNFKSNLPTAMIFLDIEKTFVKIWCTGLLYK
jgi:hypothetical protein